MSSNKAMRREAFFSGDSPYEVLVCGNVLLHRQGAQKVARRLRGVAQTRPNDAPVRVLDLACGGVPTTMATVMEQFPERRFRYTGVDINQEQIAKAKRFRFPDNVEAAFLEGSAWDVRPLRSSAPFDLIFVGLNWHHGTPEELCGSWRATHATCSPKADA